MGTMKLWPQEIEICNKNYANLHVTLSDLLCYSLWKSLLAFHNLLPTRCPLRVNEGTLLVQWLKDLPGNPRTLESAPWAGTKLESHMPWSNTEPALHN